MKKLFVFTENYVRGGGNKYLVDIVNSISDDFDQISIYSNKNGFFADNKTKLKGDYAICRSVNFITSSIITNKFVMNSKVFENTLKAFLWLLDPLFLAINIILFILLLIKEKPSKVLVCNGGYPAARGCLAMCIASKMIYLPVLISIVSMPARRKFLIFWYEKILDLLIWHSVSIVIVNANAIANQLITHRSMPSNKFSIIHNGLDEKSIDLVPMSRENTILIGYIGRIDKSKGVFYLFDAFLTLLHQYPHLELLMVGDGDSFTELVRKVNELGLNKKIKLPGHFDGDISSVLINLDIYVFPSLWEGLPYSVLEAMRSECAIVSTNVGGISEAIEDGVDGLLVPAGSSQSLIIALSKLINDTKLRAQLSSNAKLKFKRKFTLPKMATKARKIFRGV